MGFFDMERIESERFGVGRVVKGDTIHENIDSFSWLQHALLLPTAYNYNLLH